MKKTVFVTMVVLFLGLFQKSFINALFGEYSFPNLLIVLTFCLLAVGYTNTSFLFATVLGVFLDIYSEYTFGLVTVYLVSLLFVTYLIRTYLFKSSFSFYILYILGDYIYRNLFFENSPRFGVSYFLVNSLIFLIAYGLFRSFFKKISFR